ncbi:unnamed protein product, partial [Heterotrigona itama]
DDNEERRRVSRKIITSDFCTAFDTATYIARRRGSAIEQKSRNFETWIFVGK